jgi:hypothetical protein
MAYNLAGSAFMRAKDYVNAEKAYVTDLRVDVANWHWKDYPTKETVRDLLHLYDIVVEAVSAGFCLDEAHKK